LGSQPVGLRVDLRRDRLAVNVAVEDFQAIIDARQIDLERDHAKLAACSSPASALAFPSDC
jgi:hypothetical protein